MDFYDWIYPLLTGFGVVLGGVIGAKLKLREKIHIRLGIETRPHRILYSIVVFVVFVAIMFIISLLSELFPQNGILVRISGALIGGLVGGLAASLIVKLG